MYFLYKNEHRISQPVNHHKKVTKVERRKMKGMSWFRLKYIYPQKCSNENPCLALLNNAFLQTWRKVKQILSRTWYQWEGGAYKERVKEGEYGANNMYSCMKMEK
jgi:hypothetical protein